jgi:phosphoribosylformylglycinamidine synthase
MRYAVRIDVTHVPGVLDPQGATVERALPALGYANVERGLHRQPIWWCSTPTRRGNGRRSTTYVQVILANPVIERYTVEVDAWRVVVWGIPGTDCELEAVRPDPGAGRRALRHSTTSGSVPGVGTGWWVPAPRRAHCRGRRPLLRR